MTNLEEIQRDLELSRQNEAIQKYVQDIIKASEFKRFHETSEGRLLLSLGIKPFITHLDKYFETPLAGALVKDRKFLRLCSESNEVIAYIVLSTIISSINTKGKPLTATARNIGGNLKKLIKCTDTLRNDPNFISYLGKKYARAQPKYKETLMQQAIEEFNDLDLSHAPRDIRIGAMLIDMFIKSGANIVKTFKAPNGTHMIRLTEVAELVLVQALSRTHLISCTNYFPMVCKPKSWTNHNDGGYLTSRINLVKAYTKEGRHFFKDNVPKKVLNVINKMQSIPFRINTKMLDIISTIYESNILDPDTLGNKVPTLIGGLPTSNILVPEDLIPNYEYSADTYAAYKDARTEVEILLQAQQSKRMQLLITLDMAKKMREFSKFYYVYQLDYRGRVYSHINYLSPQAPSYVKSMLEFSTGEKLDGNGLYWLKVHIANCWGLDKLTFEDRIKWVDTNLDMLLRVARSPLDELKQWYKADSPYEFLAASIALLDHFNGQPIHLPIGLDATCSGIQFYSMMLRDEKGAAAVNVKNTYEIVEVPDNYVLKEDEEWVYD